jgi:hypothetical protein
MIPHFATKQKHHKFIREVFYRPHHTQFEVVILLWRDVKAYQEKRLPFSWNQSEY